MEKYPDATQRRRALAKNILNRSEMCVEGIMQYNVIFVRMLCVCVVCVYVCVMCICVCYVCVCVCAVCVCAAKGSELILTNPTHC